MGLSENLSQCSTPKVHWFINVHHHFPTKIHKKNWWYTSFSHKSKPYLNSPEGPRPASASKLLFTGPKCLAAADGRSLCAEPYGLYKMFLVKLGSDALSLSHCYAPLLWQNHHSAQACDLVASPMKFGVFFNLRGCLGFTAHVTPPAPRVCWFLCRWSAGPSMMIDFVGSSAYSVPLPPGWLYPMTHGVNHHFHPSSQHFIHLPSISNPAKVGHPHHRRTRSRTRTLKDPNAFYLGGSS